MRTTGGVLAEKTAGRAYSLSRMAGEASTRSMASGRVPVKASAAEIRMSRSASQTSLWPARFAPRAEGVDGIGQGAGEGIGGRDQDVAIRIPDQLVAGLLRPAVEGGLQTHIRGQDRPVLHRGASGLLQSLVEARRGLRGVRTLVLPGVLARIGRLLTGRGLRRLDAPRGAAKEELALVPVDTRRHALLGEPAIERDQPRLAC